MTVTILQGDCREVLATLPESSVHCCVTSPPYFGLRDYGVTGQIGLEPTPDEFVGELVAVFQEVRRVLREDGTLWLNLGDSYAGSWGAQSRPNPGNQSSSTIQGGSMLSARQIAAAPKSTQTGSLKNTPGLKPKDLIGVPWRVAFALQQPWTDWQIKSEAMRAWTAGIVDGEGCITILRTKSSHCDSYSFPPIVQVRMTDREPLDRLVAEVGSSLGTAQHPPSQVAANQKPNWQWKVVSNQAAKVIAEIYPYLTCKRKQAIVAWNHQQFRAERGKQERKSGEIEREEYCKSLINDLNQRKAVDLPSWMIEPKIIQEPGWWLRQDLIWAKPNPMPESVTDRCTKAHEYMFLLSKSEKYFYDAEAIAEMSPRGNDQQWNNVGGTRNRRSVWTVATQPFKEAHFATFPPDMVEPCIKAGCPQGGVVLDPFGGAGTTGLVADRLQRDAILIELNPSYIEIARRRIVSDAPLLTVAP